MLVSFVVTDRAAGGEYNPSREGTTRELSTVIRQGSATRERVEEFTFGPKVNLNGVEATTLIVRRKNPGEPSRQLKAFYIENGQGVKEIARQGPGDENPKTLDYDEWTLKYPLAVGATWTCTDQIYSLKERIIVPFVCEIQTMSDIVTVPAGTFERCMEVKKSFSGEVNSGAYGGNPKVTVESHSWYAPGVGLIKGDYTVKCSDPQLGGVESHSEMISYSY
jgi:hypothetical protein